MTALLTVEGLIAGYGGSAVLRGVDLEVPEGGVVALLGRNGVGKSTTVMSIIGIVRASQGSIRLGGQELIGLRPDQVARMGIGLVPQGRRVFAPLTVNENLRVAGRRALPGPWTIERVYETLPQLAARSSHRGSELSGGEQQMLAIGRALLRNPRLLLLDEPSEGLAPVIVETVTEVVRTLNQEGMAVLLVEQELRSALRLADTVAIMDKGCIVHRGPAAEFVHDDELVRKSLGVG